VHTKTLLFTTLQLLCYTPVRKSKAQAPHIVQLGTRKHRHLRHYSYFECETTSYWLHWSYFASNRNEFRVIVSPGEWLLCTRRKHIFTAEELFASNRSELRIIVSPGEYQLRARKHMLLTIYCTGATLPRTEVSFEISHRRESSYFVRQSTSCYLLHFSRTHSSKSRLPSIFEIIARGHIPLALNPDAPRLCST